MGLIAEYFKYYFVLSRFIQLHSCLDYMFRHEPSYVYGVILHV